MRFAIGCLLWALAASGWGQGVSVPSAWTWSRPFLEADRAVVASADLQDRLERAQKRGAIGSECCIVGHFDFDVRVPATGWYTLSVQGPGAGIGFRFDPDSASTDELADRVVTGTSGILNSEEAVGNFWLGAGAHVLRLERLHWTGFPDIRRVILRQGDGSDAQSLALVPDARGLFARGRCAPLVVYGGGTGREIRLTATVINDANEHDRQEVSTTFAPSAHPVRRELTLPCEKAGAYAVVYSSGHGAIASSRVRPYRFEVYVADMAGVAAPSEVVDEIDATATVPDYGSDPTVVVSRGGMSYRQGGDHGWVKYQRANDTLRRVMPEPSWFAYRLGPLVPGRPYAVEVSYPDDDDRTFALVLRERDPAMYPVSYGVDSGPAYGLSGQMKVVTMTFWPRADDARLVVMNAHDGRRAAISRIRVVRLADTPPPVRQAPFVESGARRRFASFYEEGANFLSIFGASDSGPRGWREATRRWSQLAAAHGATMLMPSVDVYDMCLFPSRIDPVFAQGPDEDGLRRLVLEAQARGQTVIAEISPRSDLLRYPYAAQPDPKPNLLVKSDGSTNYWRAPGIRETPPHENPIDPANRRWLLDLVGEIADRYRDNEAFGGIALREMTWANASLDNFVSLDWGYDDESVRQFARDTGIALPRDLLESGASAKAPARAQWLLDHARERWIQWRVDKITDIVAQLAQRVRQARSDLQLYVTLFRWDPAGLDHYREAGVDPVRLSMIPGVQVIDAMSAYGRREPGDDPRTGLLRQTGTDGRIHSIVAPGHAADFLTGAAYLEATDAIVPPTALGWPASVRRTWSSTAAAPAGSAGLARFALPLADTDAQMLGDGGNMYTFGEPEIPPFMAAYTALPAVSFERLDLGPEANPDIVVRGQVVGGAHWFYAINRSDHAAHLSLPLQGDGRLIRSSAATGSRMHGGALAVDLGPYGLEVFEALDSLSPVAFRSAPSLSQKTRK